MKVEDNFSLETKQVCEIYINGDRTKANIRERLNEFMKMCEFLLGFNRYIFHVYCQPRDERLFGGILMLYREQNPGTSISIRGQKNPREKKADFVVLFDWEEEIVGYNKEFFKIKFSNNCNDKFITKGEQIDFEKVDLMD